MDDNAYYTPLKRIDESLMLSAGEVHEEISELAAQKANSMVPSDPVLSEHFIGIANIFYSSANYSRYRNSSEAGISISYDSDRVNSFKNADDLHPRLQLIGRSAINSAVHERATSIVGVILGEARRGHDYFERHFREA